MFGYAKSCKCGFMDHMSSNIPQMEGFSLHCDFKQYTIYLYKYIITYIHIHTAALYVLKTCWSLFCLFYFWLACFCVVSLCCICLYCRYLELIFMIDPCNVLWDKCVDVWASQPEVALTRKPVCLWLVWLCADRLLLLLMCWATDWELANLKVDILQTDHYSPFTVEFRT